MTHAQDVSAQTRTPRAKTFVLLLVALAVILGLVATGGSFAYAKQFEGKALPGTQVLGHDVSGKNVEEITALLAQQKTGVTVTVKAGDSTSEVPLEELGGSIDAKATAERALERDNSMGSLVSAALQGTTTVDPVVTVDTERTEAYAKSLVPQDEASAVNASITQNEDSKEFTVNDARPGKGVDPTAFVADVKKNAPALKNFTVVQEITTVTPDLSTEDAQAALDKVSGMTGSSIVVNGPKRSYEVTKNDRLHFITVQPNKAGDAFDVTLKQDEIDAYLQTIANEIEVTKKDGVTEVTPDGKKTVVSDKQDGVSITNKKDVSEKVTAAIRDGKNLEVTYETKTEAAKVEEKKVEAPAPEKTTEDKATDKAAPTTLPSYAPAEARNGEKWIDVNLANKTLTAYVGDKVVFGPRSIVDGKAGYETVTGEYRIYLRNRFQDLTNAGRYPESDPRYYYTPDVPFVQYFYRGYAIHGAPWRSSFGYSGSHGCVNMSVADAEWMWNWAEMGTKVVSHY